MYNIILLIILSTPVTRIIQSSLQEFLFQGGGDGSLGDGGAVVVDAGGADEQDLADRDELIPFGDGSTGGHNELAINHPEGAQGSNGNFFVQARLLASEHVIHATYRTHLFAHLYIEHK